MSFLVPLIRLLLLAAVVVVAYAICRPESAAIFAPKLAPYAQTAHAYPTWSMAIQQAAAQFFMEIGGRSARPARAD